jgi:hypothetical protein
MASTQLKDAKRYLELVSESVESDPLLDSDPQAWLEAEELRRPRFEMAKTLERVSRRPPAVVHVPQRRENVTRPRERRPATRRRARAPTSDDPSEPPEQPVEVWRGVAVASVRMQTRLERRRAKWAAA